MREKLDAIVIAAIIAVLSSIGLPDKTFSLDDVVNQDKNKPKAEETKQDSTKTKSKKWYQFGTYQASGGFMFSSVSWNYNGSYDMTNGIFRGPFSDVFMISYDYVDKREDVSEPLITDWKKVKEKKQFKVSYLVTYQGKPFVKILYRSDGKFGIETKYLTGGLGGNVNKGPLKMRIDIGGGGMFGRIASEDKNYPVITTSTQFETSTKYPASVKGKFVTYLPQTQTNNNIFDSMVIDANGALSFNVDVLGFKPGIGGKLTIDNMPIPGGYDKIPRYEVFFSLTKGDPKKEKK